jgi:hypothetical protein
MRTMTPSSTRRLWLFTLLPGVALGSACTDASAPDTNPAAAEPASAATAVDLKARPGRGIDAEFTRLAREVPGFAGMYYDDAGRLNVSLKPQPVAAMRAAEVAGRLRALGGRSVQDRLGRSPNVAIREAKYDYIELQGWKSRLGKLFGVRGVVFTDIDEGQNRLRVGITPGASQRNVEQALARTGVPREAVVFSRISPIQRAKTLRDRFRPVPGGVQIAFPLPAQGPGVVGICTLGFNARIPGRGANFFLTPSHCSERQGGNQETRYFQPFTGGANRIGVEFRDPQYGNPGGLCEDFPGFRCRLSDALLARYRDDVEPQFGKIARTTFAQQRIGSLVINQNNPRWTIIGEFEFPFLGETAHKVGRSSGWTRGPVIISCGDFTVDGTDVALICQDIVLAGLRPGDSGSPVFERAVDFGLGPGQVFLVGLAWGFGFLDGVGPLFAFSSMQNIEFELGPLTTSAGELVASAQ